MRQLPLPLKFETEALNKATMVKGLHDLDCIVCPYLKVVGGHQLLVRCHHPALCVPIRRTEQLSTVPKWCPRKRAMLRDMKN
jgi:hypothetical protein